MQCKRLLTSVAAVVTLTAGTLGIAMPAASADTAPCVTERWSAAVQGRPAAHPDQTGVYLWHSSTGWHLRVNEPGADRAVFTGTVRVDGRIDSIGRHLENRGEGTINLSPNAVAFRFVNYGGMDGLEFVTHCSNTITVNVKINGATVPAEDVFIGHDGYHPASVPFTIGRGS